MSPEARADVATKLAYRQAVLEEIGGGGVYATSGAGSTSTLVCTTAFKNSSLPSDELAYAWIYVPSATAPKQRQVTKTGLDPATGIITVNDVFGSSIGGSVAFEVSTRMPLADGGAKVPGISIDQAVNTALRHFELQDDELTLAITTSDTYALTAYVYWLDRARRLKAVRQPHPITGAPIETSRTWRLRLDGELPKLTFDDDPYAVASGNLTLIVDRPADSWIATASTWAEGSGLVNESDEARPSVTDVKIVASWLCYRALAQSRSGAAQARYDGLADEALKRSRLIPGFLEKLDVADDAPAALAKAV